jgi:hypothetical protein
VEGELLLVKIKTKERLSYLADSKVIPFSLSSALAPSDFSASCCNTQFKPWYMHTYELIAAQE